MKQKNADIAIIYMEGSFETDELSLLDEMIAKYELTLHVHQKSRFVNASIDLFVPFIQVLLSPDILSEIYRNAVSTGTYDALKSILGFIWAKFHKKPFYKVRPGKVTEETPNIQFTLGNNSLVLPVNVDNEKFQYAVDRFMELASQSMPNEVTYSIYCEEDDTLQSKTESEIIAEEYAKYLQSKD